MAHSRSDDDAAVAVRLSAGRGMSISASCFAAAIMCAIALVHREPILALAVVPVPVAAYLTLSACRRFGLLIASRTCLLTYAIVILLPLAPSLGSAGTYMRLALACFAIHTVAGSVKTAHDRFLVILTIGLVLSISIGAFAASTIPYGVARFVNWAMFIPLIFTTMDRREARCALGAIFVSCAIQMVGVALQAVGALGGTWGGLTVYADPNSPNSSTRLIRYTGFIGNPNDLGLLLAVGTVAATCALLHARGRPASAAFMIAYAVLLAAGVVLTGSRGGLLAIVIGIVLVMAQAFTGSRIALLLLAVAGYAAARFWSWQPFSLLLGSIAKIKDGTDGSALQRSGVWSARLHEIGNVFTGGGFGTYTAGTFSGQTGFNISRSSAVAATVDNSWLKMLLELGVVGVGLIVLLIARAAFLSWRWRSQDRILHIALTSVLVIVIWRSLTVDMLDINPWNGILWLVLGMITSVGAAAPRPGQRDRKHITTGTRPAHLGRPSTRYTPINESVT